MVILQDVQSTEQFVLAEIVQGGSGKQSDGTPVPHRGGGRRAKDEPVITIAGIKFIIPPNGGRFSFSLAAEPTLATFPPCKDTVGKPGQCSGQPEDGRGGKR
jgi:hypothetical protein